MRREDEGPEEMKQMPPDGLREMFEYQVPEEMKEYPLGLFLVELADELVNGIYGNWNLPVPDEAKAHAAATLDRMRMAMGPHAGPGLNRLYPKMTAKAYYESVLSEMAPQFTARISLLKPGLELFKTMFDFFFIQVAFAEIGQVGRQLIMQAQLVLMNPEQLLTPQLIWENLQHFESYIDVTRFCRDLLDMAKKGDDPDFKPPTTPPAPPEDTEGGEQRPSSRRRSGRSSGDTSV